ncbi:hypothetical protein A4X06_0g3518 [Tilletia controversa]|uniref:FHA domain-containing protein n=2 Tax=Tilletia TaxID=13289 RepID=A0A8X7MUC7_9BASI|nr:hypothetical protein CF328_g9199 [Tilletia controversa]KAE8180714.1 hypothetical protein CF336_g9188 [Tilletia laevis]KAE8181394.1 hypothetical protein CF335_g8948 [Tilletia laevis]KAE8239229.1 hypothetical protein A4X03_0g8658 [Tilletia caries]KAE8248802.1 hypothetical protein A4X06_0g3518 [Tilletia controversa]
MFTVLRFTPLDSTYAPFSFVLHPRLSNRNMIDDDLLQLSFFLEAKASVKLVDDVPTIRSLRSGLGIYLNHQILGSTSSLLHDGDIVAFPQRRHNLKTAGVLTGATGGEARGASTITSSDSSEAMTPTTAAPRTFSYAALVASDTTHSSAPPLPTLPGSLTPLPPRSSESTPPSSKSSSAATHTPTSSSSVPSSTSVLTSGLGSEPASSCPDSITTSDTTISSEAAVAQDTPAHTCTPPAASKCIPHSVHASSPAAASPPAVPDPRPAGVSCGGLDDTRRSDTDCPAQGPRPYITSSAVRMGAEGPGVLRTSGPLLRLTPADFEMLFRASYSAHS